MQPGVLRALEFDRIVDAVVSQSLTPMGADRLAGLTPSIDRGEVAHLLAGTSEARRYLSAQSLFPLRAAAELPDIFLALAVDGRALEPLRLLALAAFLESIDDTRAAIRRASGSFPQLGRAAGGAASFKGEIADIRGKIDQSGEVLDHATPELKGIRERLRRQRSRLRSTLESFFRSKDTAKHLQEQVVTERNGRYVLVIKSEHRSAIPGVVHGASTSGASLYLEPLSTVEINNDIVALEEQEAEEVRRILLALADSFRARAIDLRATVDAATELDVLQARARFSESVDGIEPGVAADGRFELQAARHPLLIRRGGSGDQPPVVPVSIKIIPPDTALLITGPNTGGKTVALKTAGLLALMAQSGLHIPAAEGSQLPVFQSMFADIGDEQSIDASLSTFSGHITNIASIDRELQTPALVLLDEIGSGTDPVEGGALGVAIVDHLRRRGATVIATSHYDALKTYASTTAGVAGAAFGFDTNTFAPTYQLLYGTPGRSLAIEIASRLGLHPTVIAAARANLSAREAHLAEHLAKIDRDMRALEHEHRLATRERETLGAAETRMRQREEALRQREDTFRRRLAEELDEQVRRARREIDDVIGALKAKTTAIAEEAARRSASGPRSRPEPIPSPAPVIGAARTGAHAAVDTAIRKILDPLGAPAAAGPEAPSAPPVVGDRVAVGGLGLEGVVTTIHDGWAEVDVRGKRMRSQVRELRVVGGAPPPREQRVKVNIDLQPRDGSTSELNVIGCSVDEALSKAERFLDESLLTDHRVLRVIHGYGTGQLKRALAGFLQQHPLVVKFSAAAPEQGGGGVTVVELKE